MSGDNNHDSIFDWSKIPPAGQGISVARLTQSMTDLRSKSERDIRRAAVESAQVAAIFGSNSSLVAAGEKRVLALIERGEAALTPEKKQCTSILLEGDTMRIIHTTDETKKDALLEYCIPLPPASAGLVTYYSVERHGQQLKVVESAVRPQLDIGCSRTKVGLHELTTATEKTTSRLYQQMSRASAGDHVLHLMITALVQPADAMYKLSENSHFAYSIGDGVELLNVSAANPVQVPVFELHQKISEAYSKFYIQDSETKAKTVAPYLGNLFPATHHKLRNPDQLYDSLAFGFPLSWKVTFIEVQPGCELFTLIKGQFKDPQASAYKCIKVGPVIVGKDTQTVVACIRHFSSPSSKQDCKMFSVVSFFNTLLKKGFFVFKDGFVNGSGTSAAVKLNTPVLDLPNAVDFKTLKQTIIESLFTSTGDVKYPWKSFEMQAQALQESGVPVAPAIMQDAFGLELRNMMINKPYDLDTVLSCPFFNISLNVDCYVDSSKLKAIVKQHDSLLGDEPVLDDDIDVNTKDLLRVFLNELKASLSNESYNFGSINGTMLHLLLEARHSYTFAEFSDNFALFMFQHCQTVFKFADDGLSGNTKQHSLAYFIVCFFSTMLVTCDLLCNCKEQNELGDVFIDAMLPDDYRSLPFTDLGPSIHKYAWSLYVDRNVTQDCKLTGCNCPVYKNLNVSTFVRYFAFYGCLINTGVEGNPDSAEDAVKYARIFINQISEDVKNYVQVTRPKNQVLFGQHLRNFVNHVQLGDSGSIFDVEKKQ